MAKTVLTPRAENFPQWYQDVVAKAEMAENGPVRGTMVVRPYGYAIWERMQQELDARIKSAGARNAYFPLFIPQSYLRKEAQHVEGFSPELAVVTHGGGHELEEPVVVRPTSETIINVFFAKWVQSHRDLPLLINQWANVVRWELRPRIFLRTTEFLWQEGHTAHATREDARAYALRILTDVYEDFALNVLGIPVVVGRKTERERFAGADATYTIEGMMGDGKALQMGTSHELGQNFARAFGIEFQNGEGSSEHVWQTSWGVSTRLVGALIMAHGDDAGLRVPPRLAPIQVVVLVVKGEGGAAECGVSVAEELRRAGLRVELDDRVDVSFGRRVVDWELKGVPVRVELGPRDVAARTAGLVRRDGSPKEQVALNGLPAKVEAALAEVQTVLHRQALERRESLTSDVTSLSEATEAAQTGFARVPWDAVRDDETTLNQSGLSVRCLQRSDGGLPESSSEADLVATVAKAY
ncbi:MAG: proline--tRNA ligase [Actinobacteria bacterium]|nr:proline--tRNA ligase [Actinomycetota bacterium]